MTSATSTSRPRKRQHKRNPEGMMTIVEHIQELRCHLVLALAGTAVGTVVGFIWYQTAFTTGQFRIPFTSTNIGPLYFKSLDELLKDPHCQFPPEMRLGGGEGAGRRLLATSPFEMFMSRLKVGALAGLVMLPPWWLYQIWAYITPGLVRRERCTTRRVVTATALLFVMGSVLAYFVVAIGLEFLLQTGEETQISALTGSQYFGFLLALIVCFGVSFEVPLFLVMLNMAGVVTYESIKDKRSIIIMSLFISAAFMALRQEPISMVAMATTLTSLVEIAIQICRIHDRRKVEGRPEWLGVDNEQGSGPIAASGPIGSVGGIGDVDGIDAPTSVNALMSIQPGSIPTASVASATSPISGPTPVPAPTPVRASQMRPTRNFRPPRPQGMIPEVPMPTQDLRNRPTSDFDDVL